MKSRTDRFLEKRVIDPVTGCWIWTGSNSHGYGRFWDGSKTVPAHRFSYETFVQPVPEGMQLDHIMCDNPSCVHPGHVKPATPRDNTLRSSGNMAAVNARKTHCPQGHEYNTRRDANGGRVCYKCQVANTRKWRAKRAQSISA